MVARILLGLLLVVVAATPAVAQDPAAVARIKANVSYEQLRALVPGLTHAQYEKAVRSVALSTPRSTDYLGRYSSNPYSSQSTSNPYSVYGSPYSPKSIMNPYSQYGSPYSPNSATNPYSTRGPSLYGQDGTYLGRLNSNPYDPNSVSNPYGRYGSPYSPNSINNPYGRFGSPYSPYSVSNPYTTQAPVIIGDDDDR